ncbi:MAG TPA: Rap1a/Tai family immunity protein [Rhizomicrobium sp.]|jgi:hypothetical protein
MKAVYFFVAAVLIAGSVKADTGAPERFISTKELLDLCHGTAREQLAACSIYIQGVMMGYGVGQQAGARKRICPEIGYWDIEKVALTFLLAVDTNKRTWDKPAAPYVVDAWAKVIPCRRDRS